MTYEEFIRSKALSSTPAGFSPYPITAPLFGWQSDITRWAVKRGRAALFEDCGLGKTAQQLEWAWQVCVQTQKPVLLLTPLAVSQQTAREAVKFGIPAGAVQSQSDVVRDVNITNYEKLDRFPDPSQFGGVVLDESSILKAYDGKTRKQITEWSSAIPYRLAATATAAPNDYVELGTHAEFLGVMSQPEMLATFFVHDGGDTSKWRLKGHAEDAFWRWVASWAVAIRKPSDLGYEDGAFQLPPLRMHQHTVDSEPGDGMLFACEGQTLQERRGARRDSLADRVKLCADLVNSDPHNQWLVWCDLNDESKALAAAINGAVEVTGSDSAESKESALLAFADGNISRMVTKPSIAGWGMNWQNCSRMAFVGLSDSYEQLYQAIRRCWRFGQTQPVDVHIICSEAEGAVVRNIQRKEKQADAMFAGMVAHVRDTLMADIRGIARERDAYNATSAIQIPNWLRSAA